MMDGPEGLVLGSLPERLRGFYGPAKLSEEPVEVPPCGMSDCPSTRSRQHPGGWRTIRFGRGQSRGRGVGVGRPQGRFKGETEQAEDLARFVREVPSGAAVRELAQRYQGRQEHLDRVPLRKDIPWHLLSEWSTITWRTHGPGRCCRRVLPTCTNRPPVRPGVSGARGGAVGRRPGAGPGPAGAAAGRGGCRGGGGTGPCAGGGRGRAAGQRG